MSSVYTTNYQKLLEKLREARREAGMTQMMVADKLRKPQSYVSKIESGERRLDFIELEALAHLYRKPVSYFQTLAKKRKP